MAATSAQKRKDGNQSSKILDTITDLIERGRKAPTREELAELASRGRQARAARRVVIVPELKPQAEALATAESLRKGLENAARHRDGSELRWA